MDDYEVMLPEGINLNDLYEDENLDDDFELREVGNWDEEDLDEEED